MFELLQRAYEKGFKGRVDSFDIWLGSLGINPKLFTPKMTVRVLRDSIATTVDRESELSTIVEFVGFYERERSKSASQILHIPVIGVEGVGKSQLFEVVQAFLSKMKQELHPKLVDARNFSEIQEDQDETQAFLVALRDMTSSQHEVLLIDSCDQDKNIDNSLRAISREFSKGVLVTAWTPYHWDYFRESVEEFLPVTKLLQVDPFTPDRTEQFLSAFFRLVSEGKYSYKVELSQPIQDFSGGVASNILSLLLRSFLEAFQSKQKDIDEESIRAAAKFLALDGLQERLSKLADHQLLILKHLLLEQDPRGTRPTRLVEILAKDKATISYHLSELSKLRLLDSDRIGRWVFYRIRPEVAPLVGLRLAQEVDYLA